MSPEEIIKDYIVRELLYDTTDVALLVDDNLLGPGMLDSLNVLQLVHFVEQRFAIQIPQTDVTVTKFGSIGAIVNYIESRREQSSGN